MSSPPNEGAPKAQAASGRWLLTASLLVAVLALLAFLPVTWQGFVLGDDHDNLVFNERWRGLGAEQLGWMWTTFHMGHWQPLTWMSFGAEYPIWGMTEGTPYPPEGARYHLFGWILHALAAVLALLLFRRLFTLGFGERAGRAPGAVLGAATVAALLWAVHPMRVESVAWATERRDMLSTVFLLGTVLAYLGAVQRGGALRWTVTLVLYAASLCSKAWGITLPVVLLVLDVFPLRRWQAGSGVSGISRLALAKWLLLPLAAGAALLAARAQSSAQATLSLAEHGLVERIVQAVYGLAFYPFKTLLPLDLSTHYGLAGELDPLRFDHFASAAFVIVATLGLWLARRRAPAGLAAWVVYGVLVSPVLGLLQSGTQKVADRYAYLAALPLCALAGALLFLGLQDKRRRNALVALSLAAVVALTILSLRTTTLWEKSSTLWGRAVAVEPQNFVAQLNYATALRDEGRLQEALEHSDLSVQAEPGALNAFARFHRGLMRLQLGDFEAAQEDWQRTLELVPGHEPTAEVYSQELARRGQRQEAQRVMQAAKAARER